MLHVLAASAAAYQLSAAQRPSRIVARPLSMSSKDTATAEIAGQTKSSTVAAAAVAALDVDMPWFGFGDTLGLGDARSYEDAFSDDEIEAMFNLYDRDSGGDISKSELAEALFRFGYRIPKDRF